MGRKNQWGYDSGKGKVNYGIYNHRTKRDHNKKYLPAYGENTTTTGHKYNTSSDSYDDGYDDVYMDGDYDDDRYDSDDDYAAGVDDAIDDDDEDW